MIELSQYRHRIGIFRQKVTKSRSFKYFDRKKLKLKLKIKSILISIFPILMLLGIQNLNIQSTIVLQQGQSTFQYSSGSGCEGKRLGEVYIPLGKHLTSNFKARYLHGNKQRGILSIHVNIRSLYNKMSEVKNIISKEKPHILGISEAELKKSHHHLGRLKVPGYQLLLPKSWEMYGKARLVVYIKKSLEFQQIFDLEKHDVQSIWVRAGFKNNKKVYFSHVYREHTCTLGNSMAAQRKFLENILTQWEDSVLYGNCSTPNEVHISGDMNLDCLGGKWLESDYNLVALARMVLNCCNTTNLTQMVDKVTRVQFNSVMNKTVASCIDHVYSNAKHRISPVRVIPCGTSDHDAIAFTRYSKEPLPPSKTVRKRSYKKFKKEEYLKDIGNLDFTDVYSCLDVDDAVNLLTSKIVEVLNTHAPWIVFQHRKHFVPWLTPDTVKLMEERDRIKQEAKAMAISESDTASQEQAQLWARYKKLRNSINNKVKQEERIYKRKKVQECQNCPSKTWRLAKSYMEWNSPGPPGQLEVLENNQIKIYSKARDIAEIMNNFFISKVQKIVEGLRKVPLDLSGCRRIMQGKNTRLSMKYVTVQKVRKLLCSLKNTTSTSIDQLDNFAVRIAADQLAGPLHHVISLSVMQQKFPTSWKLTKIVPLHKKNSPMQRENYRPVAILSPLSKVLEKVMYEVIHSYFEKNNLFHPSLHGYRRDRSTMTALLSMYDKWVKAASMGQVSGVVLVDLSAAFDLVMPSLLIQKLKIYGLDEDFASWVSSYLTGRFQAVWINHVFSDFKETNIGVPQGSNLGPLFFLIYFNDLPSFIDGQVDCYADDSSLGSTAKDARTIGENLTSDCGKLSSWMEGNKFKLNVDKTHFMIMGTAARLQITEQVKVNMDGVELSGGLHSKETLLGISVQSNLKWSSQVEQLAMKLKKRLTGLGNLRYLMSRSVKKSIVQGVFNSVLCYCLPLFGGCSNMEIQILQVQQNKAAQIVLNFPPRTNRDLMFDKLDWLTVFQLIVYHTLITVFRIRQSEKPEHLASILCRDNHNGHIIMMNPKLQVYKDSFIYRGAILWNKLPRILRTGTKIGKYKKDIRKWIAENVPRFVG